MEALRKLVCVIGFLVVVPLSSRAQSQPTVDLEKKRAEVEDVFRSQVTRFIKTYCLDCHQNRRPTEAGVNFSPALKNPAHAAFTEQWQKAAARVEAHDMPPEGLEQPSEEERQVFLDWIDSVKYLSPKDPGPFVIRRLTKSEYGNTLHELFGIDPAIVETLPDEVSGEGYMNALSPLQLEQYLSITDQVLSQAWPDATSLPVALMRRMSVRQIEESDLNDREAVRGVAMKLAGKIYRRPASDDEVDVLLDVFDLAQNNGLGNVASLRLMVKATLVSPQFLFITPAVVASPDAKVVPLDSYQLASRLSYFLWASPPDEQLMALAAAGKLSRPAILRAQVQRMLASTRSRALFDGFGAQWLGLDDWNDRLFDSEKYPQMDAHLRTAMYEEASLFFQHVVRNNKSVAAFIDSDFTFMNSKLAAVYGLNQAGIGPEMRKVALEDPNRGGVLGMPAVLAATSFPDRTSPVNRGVWVLEQVLGEHVPAAPPDVPALEIQDQQAVADLTLRKRTEMHRSAEVCANCHRLLDPIGFGLENFDAIGRWRETDDNGRAIDAAGELPNGERFSSPVELKKMIAGRLPDFARNLTEKLLAYALCRKLSGYDAIVVDEIAQRVERDGYRMQTLVAEIVVSYPFTHRRLEDER